MLNCHKIIYDESKGYKIFIFFFIHVREGKIKQGEQHTYFLCLLLSLLLPNNPGKRWTGSISVTVLSRILYHYGSDSLKFVLNLIPGPPKQVPHRLLKAE